MKKKILTVALSCFLAMSLFSGCGSSGDEESGQSSVSESSEAEELKSIGNEETGSLRIVLTNSTGKEITGFAVKLSEDLEYPESLIRNDSFRDKEARNFFYTLIENDSDKKTDSDEIIISQGYDIKIVFADGSEAVLHSFPMEDIEKGEICLDGDVAYLKYKSLLSGQNVETKEAEKKIAEDNKAAEQAKVKAEEEAAAKAAEAEAAARAAEEEAARQAAQAEAAAQAAAEEAARQAAAAQAAAEEAARQAAEEAARQAAANAASQDSGQQNEQAGGCIDEDLALTY